MCSDLDSELYYDLAERLTKTRSQHPSFQLMEVDENLFPEARIQLEECQAQGSAAEAPRPLAAFFQESWSSPTQNHLMLEGEGGIGKTVALLSLTTREHFLPRHVPAVYIPLHAPAGRPRGRPHWHIHPAGDSGKGSPIPGAGAAGPAALGMGAPAGAPPGRLQ